MLHHQWSLQGTQSPARFCELKIPPLPQCEAITAYYWKKSSQYFNDLAVISLFTYTCSFPPAILLELGSSRRDFFLLLIIWCCSYLFIIIIICLQANRVILVTPNLSACLTATSKPLSQKCLTLLNLFHEKGPVCVHFPFHEASLQHFNRWLVAWSCLTDSRARQRSVCRIYFSKDPFIFHMLYPKSIVSMQLAFCIFVLVFTAQWEKKTFLTTVTYFM